MRIHYSTDWLRTKKSIEKEFSTKLIGIWHFNYPVYCIHTIILDSSPSEFQALDKQVFSLLKLGHSTSIISVLLGLKKQFINSRVSEMKSHNLVSEEDGNLRVTELGIKTIEQGSEKLYRKRRYDFYLDGIELKLLPKSFYANRILEKTIIEDGLIVEKYRFEPGIEHQIFTLEDLENQIKSVPDFRRDEFSIPTGLEKIEDCTYTKMIYPVLVSLEYQKDNLYSFRLLDPHLSDPVQHNFDFINLFNKSLIPRLGNDLRIQVISFRRKTEYGEKPILFLTTNWNEIDKYRDTKLPFIGSNSDLKEIVDNYYSARFSNEDILVNQGEINFIVDKNNFKSTVEKLRILRSLERGFDLLFRPKDTIKILVVNFDTSDPYIEELLKYNNILKRQKDIRKIFEELKGATYPKEQILLDLEKHHILEKIAIEEHFKFIRNG